MMATGRKLYTPFHLGAIDVSHRVVLAPLTRMRAELPGDLPTPLMATYYAQRASEGGLLVTEGSTISEFGRGYIGAPGIYTDAQVVRWQAVTAAVHRKGGLIFMQLWHTGRTSHTEFTGGALPIAPSETSYEGMVRIASGWCPATPARALELHEIGGRIAEYRDAARRAQAAGFDGVEIHGANGYLLDQFLQDGSNRRTDRYGGTAENRTRLLMEVCKAVIEIWGEGRVGVRLSPSGSFNGMHDSNPQAIFGHAAAALETLSLAYLHVIEPRIVGVVESADGIPPIACQTIRDFFSGPIIAAGGFDRESAEAIVESGDADLVAFGRSFIANPDLPARLSARAPLNPYDRDTFYDGGAHGYTDYPALMEV